MKKVNYISPADMTQSETANNEALIEMAVAFLTLMNACVEDAVRRVINEKQEEEKVNTPYYTRKEAASRLGVSTETLWRMQKLTPDKFVTVKSGRKLFFSKACIESIISKEEDLKTR